MPNMNSHGEDQSSQHKNVETDGWGVDAGCCFVTWEGMGGVDAGRLICDVGRDGGVDAGCSICDMGRDGGSGCRMLDL
jgi:hypothetical protein